MKERFEGEISSTKSPQLRVTAVLKKSKTFEANDMERVEEKMRKRGNSPSSG